MTLSKAQLVKCPTLSALIDHGVLYVEDNGSIIGRAADDAVVSVGDVYHLDVTEQYFVAHPEPKDW